MGWGGSVGWGSRQDEEEEEEEDASAWRVTKIDARGAETNESKSAGSFHFLHLQ